MARPIMRDDNGTRLSKERVKAVQRYINWWRRKYLKDKSPLRADGEPGKLTLDALGGVRWALGYGPDRNSEKNRNRWTKTTVRRMQHPHSRKYSSRRMLATGAKRRRAYRARRAANRAHATVTSGVATFDGKPVARCLLPHLRWARANGWRGRLNSGWRAPWYSRSLCIRMCGRPSCPGRCAGTSSNHSATCTSGSRNPAVDVSDYYRFGQLMRRCPHGPRIFNALGARDPVHFSPSGR